MCKIIFLDFDGVMDTAYYDNFCVANGLPESDEYGCVFDPECVKALGRIIDATDASIVVTSTWKDFMTIDEFQMMWNVRRLPGEIIDATPTISKHRGDEIDAWLNAYGQPCDYVILDDIPFSEFNSEHITHFVQVNPYDGLNVDLSERAIGILNK